jgi:prepilin-type N-terminal cleavage/methylation domain-containing protein
VLARIRKAAEDKDSGFTLIELLVVMIIIGILAAIAIPVFLNQRKKAVDSSLKSDLRSVATEMETAFTDSGSYPTALPADAKVTTGNNVTVETAGAAAGTYCLKATSTKASGDWYYDSDKGGLQAKDVACS